MKFAGTLLCALSGAAISCAAFAADTVELFNGKNLDGWTLFADGASGGDVFSAKDGIIRVKGKPFGYMFTNGKYSDFRLHVEWMYPAQKSNSGIFLFVQNPPAIWPNAVECQLCADRAGDFVLLGGSDVAEYKAPEGGARPAFPVVSKRGPSNENPVGEWNSADIICKDGSIEVFINGTLQNRATGSMHKSGHIGLQSEGGEILFRNVRLTPLE